MRPAQPLTAFLPGMTSWEAQGLGGKKTHIPTPSPRGSSSPYLELPPQPWTPPSVTVRYKRSAAASVSMKLPKKKGKKGQALHPAVGEAAFSAAADDSQCPSWRLELGMRPERLVCRGKPQFPSTPACREERSRPVKSQPLAAGMQLPLQPTPRPCRSRTRDKP